MGAGWTRWYRPGGDIRPRLFLYADGYVEERVKAVMGVQPAVRSRSYPPPEEREMYWLLEPERKSFSERYTEAFRTEIIGRFFDDDEKPGTWLGQPRLVTAPPPRVRWTGFTVSEAQASMGLDCVRPGCKVIDTIDGPMVSHDTRDERARHPCHVIGHATENMGCLVHSGVHYRYPTKSTLLRNIRP